MGSSSKRPSDRSFGLSVGGVCLIIAAFLAWRGRPTGALVIGMLGAVLVLAGLVVPAWLATPAALWWRLAQVLSYVNTRVFLSIVFIGLFVPMGWLRRTLGWDPLQQRGTRASGWAPQVAQRDSKHFDRMY